jgi:hypothetical protein
MQAFTSSGLIWSVSRHIRGYMTIQSPLDAKEKAQTGSQAPANLIALTAPSNPNIAITRRML